MPSAISIAATPNTTDTPRQPITRDQRRPDDGDEDRPDVAAGDVGTDREPASLRRVLLGEQPVADRVLR